MSGSLGIELSVAQSDLVQALSVLLLGKKLHSRSFFSPQRIIQRFWAE